MNIPGDRIKRTRLVHTDNFVVAVDVELVIPNEDPSGPCYDAATLNLLREVREHAEQGDLVWLKQHGKVYSAVGSV